MNLAFDDFGTGYSSLAYLKNFPIDTLKIDRSFVQDIVFNCKVAAIAQTIVQLAQNLEIDTVAEGVETEAQLKLLEKVGWQEYQSFYLSRPVRVLANACYHQMPAVYPVQHPACRADRYQAPVRHRYAGRPSSVLHVSGQK